MGVYVAGRISGAHLNPAVTLALAVFRGFPWRKVLPYFIVQTAGAFVAAALVYWNYRLQFLTVDPTLERTAGSVPRDLRPLPKDAGAERDRVMRANHDRANCFVLAEATAEARGGGFAVRLEVPEKVPGNELILRAYAATDRADGQGVLRLAVGR